MTKETCDFYSCQQCNGEAVWDHEDNSWRYDCPYADKKKK